MQLKQIQHYFLSVYFFLRAFIDSCIQTAIRLKHRYQILLFSVIITLVTVTGLAMHVSYSQDVTPTISDGVSTQQQTGSSISSHFVRDEFTQLMTLGNDLVQGSTDAVTGKKTAGLMNMVTNMDAFVYMNNPVSLKQYSRYYAQTHGIVKSSYAQTTGSGYNTLVPVLPLWEIARNVSYLIVAVMIVFIGFIIIFGGKYGQAEISIVSSIPRIIITLILISFSYPIAGFAIDMSNLGTKVIVNLLGPNFVQKNFFYAGQYPVRCGKPLPVPADSGALKGTDSSKQVLACGYFASGVDPNDTLGGDFNVFRMMSPIVNYQDWNVQARDNNQITQLLQTPTNIGFLDAFLQGIPFNAVGNLAGITVNFIMNILMLFWAIKIFILILTSFVKLVVTAMLSPFLLIQYPLKGGSVFFNFIGRLLAPALVFPAVFAMLFVAAIFAYGTDCIDPGGHSGPCVANPESNNLTPFSKGPWYIANGVGIKNFNTGPLIFVDTINPAFIWNFVAIGIVVAIPAIGKELNTLLKVEVSRNLGEQSGDAGQRAMKYASKLPILGGILGKVL